MPLPTPAEVAASKDILFECRMGGTRVVGIGNEVVIKYGPRVRTSEADSLSFVSQHTALPVPKVLGTYTHKDTFYIVMTRIRGQQLSELLPNMSANEIDAITDDLKRMINEMRGLQIMDFEKESFIGSIGCQPCADTMFRAGHESKGPFKNVDEMHDNILQRYNNRWSRGTIWTEYTRRMYKENAGRAIVFTHGDLSPGNIMVESGRISGIIDWEQAGWYPEYWEYVKAMAGSIDTWQTVWPVKIAKWLHPYDYLKLIDEPMRLSFR
jgi:serine/threonine protein kinase